MNKFYKNVILRMIKYYLTFFLDLGLFEMSLMQCIRIPFKNKRLILDEITYQNASYFCNMY